MIADRDGSEPIKGDAERVSEEQSLMAEIGNWAPTVPSYSRLVVLNSS